VLSVLLPTLAIAAPAPIDRAPVTVATTLAAGIAPEAPGAMGGAGSVHLAWHPGRFGVEVTGRVGWWPSGETLASKCGLSALSRHTHA